MMGKTNLSEWAKEQFDGDDSPELRRLLGSISSLSKLEQWVPRANEMHVLDVIPIAAGLSRIDREHCRVLVAKIVHSILREGRPSPDDMAELSAAAVLCEWATEVRSVPTHKSEKTPDFLAQLSGISVEVEVTNSDEKLAQVARRRIAHRLAERLRAANGAARLKVRFLDGLSDSEVDTIASAVQTLAIGQSVQHEGRWYVESLPEGSDQLCLGDSPSWWTSPFATSATLHISALESFGIDPTFTEQQRIDVQWALSTQSYLNSLSKKQDAEQASGTKPFLVVCDVTRLPGAFAWYEANLPAYLSKWSTALSSVLLLQGSFQALRAVRWDYRLFANPNATIPWSPEIRIPESGYIEEPFFPS